MSNENIETKEISEVKEEIRNKVYARGRILGIGKDSYGRPRFILYIRSNSSRPASYISFSLEKVSLGDIRVNDVVDVEGHMVAYQIRNRVWNRTAYTQYIVADSVKLCDTELKRVFGCDKGFAFGRQYIQVCLAGRVENAESNEETGWHNIAVRVEEKGKRPCTINVQYSSKMRVNDVKCKKDDEICLVATVYSRKTERDGTVRYYENIVADDIGIIRSAEEEEQEDTLFSGMGEDN